MLKYSYSAIAHLQKAPITASLELVPDSRYFAYGRKYHDLFKWNVSSAHFRKKIHITESYLSKFLENILNHEKNLQDLRGQNPCKNVGLV